MSLSETEAGRCPLQDRQLPRVADLGVTEVYPLREDSNITVDIILVHGLKGHPLKTWTYGKVDTSDVTPHASRSEKRSRSFG